MTNTKILIDNIRKVYYEKKLTISTMENLMIAKGKQDIPSRTTIGRFFSRKNQSIYNYRYEDTIRPFAEVLLDVDTIEETDDLETKAMKSFVKVKGRLIDNLEKENHELESELNVYERLEKERDQARRSIDFLKTQIERKDQRIDRLLESNESKDAQIKELNQQINDLILQMKSMNTGK